MAKLAGTDRNRRAGETLTTQEVQAAYLAHYDMGPGYPQLPVPAEIFSLYERFAAQSLMFPPEWTPSRQETLDMRLTAAVQSFLSVPSSQHTSVCPTFSGSVALDRAIAAASMLVSSDNQAETHVVATTPSIDIMRLFLEERRHLKVHFVESRIGGVWGLESTAIVAVINKIVHLDDSANVIVVLSSPENPTGLWWNRAQLSDIANRVGELRGVLIVDHAFLAAGVQPCDSIPAIWSIRDIGCDWIGLWDSGKTFGLNEDKLGFLICGCERTAEVVRACLSITQFGVARRHKIFFAELLEWAARNNYAEMLRQVCAINLAAAETITNSTRLQLILPPAGSNALLRLPLEDGDEFARLRLLEFGVGVVSGRVFFHTDWKETDLIRVALARNPPVFRRGFELLTEVLERVM